jgi:endoglycosylceramidase
MDYPRLRVMSPAGRATVFRVTQIFAFGLALATVVCGAGCGDDDHRGGVDSSTAVALHPKGRWLVDTNGRVAILHGFNLDGVRAPFLPQTTGFSDDDARFLADHGFNVVRLGFMLRALLPQPGVLDRDYLEKYAQAADLLARHGIFTLVDFHQDNFDSGHGWPDWMFPNGDPTNEGPPAWDSLWRDDPLPTGLGIQEEVAAAWAAVAERFRDHQMVVGYDLFNEPQAGATIPPNCPLSLCNTLDRDLLTPFYRKIVAAIRAVDPRTPIFLNPGVQAQVAGVYIGAVGDPSTVLSIHVYCAPAAIYFFLNGHPLDDATQDVQCPPNETKAFKILEDYTAQTAMPAVVSEFGAEYGTSGYHRVAELMDEHMVGWMAWTYAHVPGQYSDQALVLDAFQPLTDDNIRQERMQYLDRPFPRFIAGTPVRWSFDLAAGRFELEYSTLPADGELSPSALTELYIPERHFPGGYCVAADGARQTTSAQPSLVTLRNQPGTASVTVAITRRSAATGCNSPAQVVTQ